MKTKGHEIAEWAGRENDGLAAKIDAAIAAAVSQRTRECAEVVKQAPTLLYSCRYIRQEVVYDSILALDKPKPPEVTFQITVPDWAMRDVVELNGIRYRRV